MSLTTRFTRLAAGAARRLHRAARPHPVRPVLERLESRLVLDISINFVGGRGGLQPPPMDPSEVAGVVPDGNWNQVMGAAGPIIPGLNDQNGNPVPGTSLYWGGANTWAREDGGLPDAPGDSRMMEGYLDSTNTSTSVVWVQGGLSALAPYDVVVYFSGDNHTGRHGFYTVVGVGTQEGMDIAPFDGTYVQDDGTGSGGNFLRFTGATSDSLLLFASAQDPNSFDNGFRAPINGIQIVQESPHAHQHQAHALAPSVGGLPGLTPTSLWQVQPPAPSSPTTGGVQTGGALSAAQINALFTAPTANGAAAPSGLAGTAAQVDAVFADPIHSAF
jgi:hypothetical protein